jgi:SpoVK/Ycf46/Vps4 family AAA+-type ATPase
MKLNRGSVDQILECAGHRAAFAVLFTGPNAADKAAVIAQISRESGRELYRVDLRATITEFIGETEKNLNRIIDDAQQRNAILFFDEADALFSKRTEVKDAHCRFANIETSYLLQRLETFPGLAILVTNERHDFDEAFLARFRFVVEFC